jgi:hypothetical protein
MLPVLASEIRRKERRGTPVRWLSVFAALFVLAPAGQANATLFYNTYSGNVCQASTGGCLQAGMFGLLAGWDHPGNPYYTGTLVDSGNSSISVTGAGTGGDVGIGPGSTIKVNASSAQTWTGPIDFADTGSATAHGGLYHVPSTSDTLTNVTVTNGTVLSASAVDTALNQILSISNFYSTYSTQTVLSSLGGTNTTLTVSGVKVYSVSTINFNKVLTIVGGPSDVVVFNSSSAIFRNNGGIVLSGGITPDQVLFNLTGTGTDLSISGNDSIFADFIVRGAYNVSAATINGRILGGTGTLTLGNNLVMQAPADATPEPGEWALMAGGIGALVYLGRRRSRRSGPDLKRRFRGGSDPPIEAPAIPPPCDGGSGG